MRLKKINLKKLGLGVFAFVLVACLITNILVLYQNSAFDSFPNNSVSSNYVDGISAPQPESSQAYDYKVSLLESTSMYYAINGRTGTVDFQSSDANSVIQYVFDNLSSNEGPTVILQGPFYNLGNITFPKFGVHVVGVNAQLHLDPAYVCIFMRNDTDTDYQYDVTLENLNFYGFSYASGIAVNTYQIITGNHYGITNFAMCNCYVYRFLYGLNLHTGLGNAKIHDNTFRTCSYDIRVVNCIDSNIYRNTLYIGDWTGKTDLNGMYIVDSWHSHFDENNFVGEGLGNTARSGITQEATAICNSIDGNIFENLDYIAISIGDDGTRSPDNAYGNSYQNNIFNLNDRALAIRYCTAYPFLDSEIAGNIVRGGAKFIQVGTEGENISCTAQIHDNQVSHCTSTEVFAFYGDAYYVEFTRNILPADTSPHIDRPSNPYLRYKISENKGFVTESHVRAGVANGSWVKTGLSGKIAHVNFDSYDDVRVSLMWTGQKYAANATHVQVWVSTGHPNVDFYFTYVPWDPIP
jgi:hypothetical protein